MKQKFALIFSVLREEPDDLVGGIDGEVLGLAKGPHDTVPDTLDESHKPDHQPRAGWTAGRVIAHGATPSR